MGSEHCFAYHIYMGVSTMKIKVNHYFNYGEDLSVVIDGICNHAGFSTEWDTVELVNPNGQDQVFDVLNEICDKCRSYKEQDEEQWHGMSIMPEVTAMNSGKVFTDIL